MRCPASFREPGPTPLISDRNQSTYVPFSSGDVVDQWGPFHPPMGSYHILQSYAKARACRAHLAQHHHGDHGGLWKNGTAESDRPHQRIMNDQKNPPHPGAHGPTPHAHLCLTGRARVAPPLRSAPTAVERTNRSYVHRVRQSVTPSTMAPFTSAGSATGASTPGIQIVRGRWTRQTSPKFPGAVPCSMKGVVTSSLWHHRQEDIDDPVKAVNPSRQEQDR